MELKLGINKTVKLIPWKSKTKKDFIKVFKKKGEKATEEDMISVLMTPYIEPNDVFYSSDEIQYILGTLRQISIEDVIKFSIDCDNKECGEEFPVETTVEDLMYYKESEYPKTLDNIIWRDLPKSNSLSNLIKKYPEEPPKDLEVLIHIEAINDEVITSFDHLLKLTEELTLSEGAKIDEDFKKVKSSLEIKTKTICPHCNLEKEYIFDIIPTYFDPLLPKDM